jgi:hypothetical protein
VALRLDPYQYFDQQLRRQYPNQHYFPEPEISRSPVVIRDVGISCEPRLFAPHHIDTCSEYGDKTQPEEYSKRNRSVAE